MKLIEFIKLVEKRYDLNSDFLIYDTDNQTMHDIVLSNSKEFGLLCLKYKNGYIKYKKCHSCGKMLSINCFNNRSINKDGRSNSCRECSIKKQRESRRRIKQNNSK